MHFTKHTTISQLQFFFMHINMHYRLSSTTLTISILWIEWCYKSFIKLWDTSIYFPIVTVYFTIVHTNAQVHSSQAHKHIIHIHIPGSRFPSSPVTKGTAIDLVRGVFPLSCLPKEVYLREAEDRPWRTSLASEWGITRNTSPMLDSRRAMCSK